MASDIREWQGGRMSFAVSVTIDTPLIRLGEDIKALWVQRISKELDGLATRARYAR